MKKECNTVSFKNQVIYVGIDIHKNSWQVSIRHCRHQLANFSILRTVFPEEFKVPRSTGS